MAGVPTDLFDCGRVSSYLEAYLLDRVPPPERRGMRLHIHKCPACFAKVMARDPLQLFAPLADQQREARADGGDLWEGLWDGIAEGIRKEESLGAGARLLRGPWLRPALITAAAAAVILLAAVALLRLPQTPSRPELASLPATARPVAEAGGDMPLPPVVEAVRTPDARPVTVYTMSYEVPPDQGGARPAGDGKAVAQLVLIVDGGLEL